eukprot:gene12329-6003_t
MGDEEPDYASVKQHEDDNEQWEDWEEDEPQQDMFNEISKIKKKTKSGQTEEIDTRVLDKSQKKSNLKND